MRTVIYIIITFIGLGFLFYWFVIRPIKKANSNIGSGNYQSPPRPIHNGDGFTIPTEIELPIVSKEVQEADVVAASDPSTYFTGLTDNNINSHNIHTTRDKVEVLISYSTSFTKSCPAYIWYKYGLYSYVNTKTDDQGNKICFYKFDPSVLPSQLQIKMSIPPYQCKEFKYYLSGVEYRYKESKTTPDSLMGINHFCIYQKQ